MCEEHSPYIEKTKKRRRVMEFKLIEKVIREMVEYGLKEIIPSTMGEPLLYKDFKELIDLIRGYNLKLNLTTNGTFPILGVEKWAYLILPVLSDIKISINGSYGKLAENIMRGLDYQKQIDNIMKLVKLREEIKERGINNPSITFQVTFMERNVLDLPELLKLAIDLNIDRFKGHHLWITNEQIMNESLKKDKNSIKKWNHIVDELKRITREKKLQNGNYIKLDNVYKLDNSKESNVLSSNYLCPFLGREVWIAWDGTFNVCCAPENLRRKFGSFGNIKDTSFLELWKSTNYKDLVENWGRFEVCKICNMKKPDKTIKRI